jgi:hypothetical protein
MCGAVQQIAPLILSPLLIPYVEVETASGKIERNALSRLPFERHKRKQKLYRIAQRNLSVKFYFLTLPKRSWRWRGSMQAKDRDQPCEE